MPSLRYELYSSWGNFAVPEQIADGGPELHYYPEAGLLHLKFDGGWLRLSDSGERTLGRALAEALAKKEAGELELGPIRADFRVRHLADAAYTLNAWSEDFRPRDYSSFGEPWLDGPSLGKLSGPRAENFVMEELVATLGSTPATSPRAVATVAISYTASDPETRTGYGGLLGFYAPPEGGRPGRFWHDGYFYDGNTPYYETTPGFDAIIAGALAPPPVIAAPEGGGGESWLAWIVAGAAGVALAIVGGSLLRVSLRRKAV